MMIEKWATLLQGHKLHDDQFLRTNNAFGDIVHDSVTDKGEARRRFTAHATLTRRTTRYAVWLISISRYK
jgi:hypothetical protein